MKVSRILVLVVLGLFVTGGLFAAVGMGSGDLDRAKQAMDAGDFRTALDQLRSISQNPGFSPEVQREAAYFLGFCCVKMQDPWGAANAFQSFLARYDRGGDPAFIPDALYVLGRTFEQLSQNSQAAQVYQRCVAMFPTSEFAAKSQDRLRIIGGMNPGGAGSMVTPEIAGMIDLAKRCPDSFSADQMLMKAAQCSRTGADFIAVSQATRSEYTRSLVIAAAQKSPVFNSMNVQEIVDLGKTTNDSNVNDQLLVAAAKGRPCIGHDFVIISQAARSEYMRSLIIAAAQQSAGFSAIPAQEIVELGKTTRDSNVNDQLLVAAVKARSGPPHDFVILSQAARSEYMRSLIIAAVQQSAGFRTMYVGDVIDLARTTNDSNVSGQLLVAAARNMTRGEDFAKLMDATTSSYTKSQIMAIAQQVMGNRPNYNISMWMTASPEGLVGKPKTQSNSAVSPQPTKKIKEPKKTEKRPAAASVSRSDPFNSFNADAKRIARVNWFLDAVKTKTRIEETSRALTREDMSLEVVKSALRETAAMKKFETIHGK